MRSCFIILSIYRSLSFIYMWTAMVMTLYTLQFNPIIDILTRKKVTRRKYLFFRQSTFCDPFVRPWLGLLAILSVPKKISHGANTHPLPGQSLMFKHSRRTAPSNRRHDLRRFTHPRRLIYTQTTLTLTQALTLHFFL